MIRELEITHTVRRQKKQGYFELTILGLFS